MKLLDISSGCREPALAWKLAQSEQVKRVYRAPRNRGTQTQVKGKNFAVPETILSAEGAEVSVHHDGGGVLKRSVWSTDLCMRSNRAYKGLEGNFRMDISCGPLHS
jgi:hypothetical protein